MASNRTSHTAPAAPAHRPTPRRQRSRSAVPAQVHATGTPQPQATAAPPVAAVPLPFPTPSGQAIAGFQPRALLAPAADPQPPAPVTANPGPNAEAADPANAEAIPPETAGAPETDAAALMQDLGIEPAPGTPEALALLAAVGVAPRPAPGEPLGPDDERFSPIALGHLTHRLVEVKRFLEQLTAEQKTLHETLRLAHLRGDLIHLLAPSSEGWCYQLSDGTLLSRRQGRKQWAYSNLWAEMEAQLKARQTYEQATGMAAWRHGAAFWDLRGQKG